MAPPHRTPARTSPFHHPAEHHASRRSNWLRAGVLGANDGLLSTSGLLVGVASASASRSVLLATGVAALVSGAASMAIGEYSSVSSQRDAERADLAIEATELEQMPRAELRELAHIYEQRGLEPALAAEVARQLTDHDALASHARDELGLDPDHLVNPVEAAFASAVSFSVGALLPLLVVLGVGGAWRQATLVATALVGLALLGAVGAALGGADRWRGAARVAFGGAAAMVLTSLVGRLFDVAVG
jgi:VIT1/CCC1 family predicted Fe2+/Mn2+ transporter